MLIPFDYIHLISLYDWAWRLRLSPRQLQQLSRRLIPFDYIHLTSLYIEPFYSGPRSIVAYFVLYKFCYDLETKTRCHCTEAWCCIYSCLCSMPYYYIRPLCWGLIWHLFMPLFDALLLYMAFVPRPDMAFIHAFFLLARPDLAFIHAFVRCLITMYGLHAFVRCLITIYGLYAEACWHLFMPLFDALLLYMAFMLRPIAARLCSSCCND